MKTNKFLFLYVVLFCGCIKTKTFKCDCTTRKSNIEDGTSTVIRTETYEIKSKFKDDADVDCSQKENSINMANGFNERTSCILKQE
ncbi:MAG: hypothetical protein ACK4K9_02725 [Bacteroidia bacterium]